MYGRLLGLFDKNAYQPARTIEIKAIADVVDLKRWIVEHIDEFSQCLAEQLLTYATGRDITEEKARQAQLDAMPNPADPPFAVVADLGAAVEWIVSRG